MTLIPNEIFLNGGDKFPTGAHEYMLDVLGRFDRKEFRFFMLNWARRHHKTTLAVNLLLKECFKGEIDFGDAAITANLQWDSRRHVAPTFWLDAYGEYKNLEDLQDDREYDDTGD